MCVTLRMPMRGGVASYHAVRIMSLPDYRNGSLPVRPHETVQHTKGYCVRIECVVWERQSFCVSRRPGYKGCGKRNLPRYQGVPRNQYLQFIRRSQQWRLIPPDVIIMNLLLSRQQSQRPHVLTLHVFTIVPTIRVPSVLRTLLPDLKHRRVDITDDH
jgi:hypothetical protein